MIKPTNAINKFYDQCRELDLRITPQRTIIFEVLTEALDHPTAESVYRQVRKKLPTISYDTVNRTLLSFSELGIIKVIESRGSVKRFDPNTGVHHHFQCVQCNRIIDFINKDYDQLKIPKHLNRGLKVLNKKVVLEGICDKCNQKKSNA